MHDSPSVHIFFIVISLISIHRCSLEIVHNCHILNQVDLFFRLSQSSYSLHNQDCANLSSNSALVNYPSFSCKNTQKVYFCSECFVVLTHHKSFPPQAKIPDQEVLGVDTSFCKFLSQPQYP